MLFNYNWQCLINTNAIKSSSNSSSKRSIFERQTLWFNVSIKFDTKVRSCFLPSKWDCSFSFILCVSADFIVKSLPHHENTLVESCDCFELLPRKIIPYHRNLRSKRICREIDETRCSRQEITCHWSTFVVEPPNFKAQIYHLVIVVIVLMRTSGLLLTRQSLLNSSNFCSQVLISRPSFNHS